MQILHSLEFKAGTLTVALPREISSDRLDEITRLLDKALTSEGVGRFAWHQQGKHHQEMVFHVFGQRATLMVRAELDRLGYDRRVLIVTDYA